MTHFKLFQDSPHVIICFAAFPPSLFVSLLLRTSSHNRFYEISALRGQFQFRIAYRGYSDIRLLYHTLTFWNSHQFIDFPFVELTCSALHHISGRSTLPPFRSWHPCLGNASPLILPPVQHLDIFAIISDFYSSVLYEIEGRFVTVF